MDWSARSTDGIVLGVFLIGFALLAWVKYSYPVRFGKVLEAVFNERITKQLKREEAIFAHRASAVHLLTFALALTLIVRQVVGHFSGLEIGLLSLLSIFGGLLLFSLTHWGLHVLFGSVTKSVEEVQEYVFMISLLHKTSVLVLLPLAFVSEYATASASYWSTVAAVSVVSVMLVYRVVRGIRIAWGSSVSPFYFVLYLCALEILPFLLVFRGIESFSS